MTALGEGPFVGSEAMGESRVGSQVLLELWRKVWCSSLSWEGLGEAPAGRMAQELDFKQTELKTPVRDMEVSSQCSEPPFTDQSTEAQSRKNFPGVHSQD